MHTVNWNSAKSWWSIDFCQYRNDACPVMATFSEKAWLSTCKSYPFLSKCACRCARLVCRKVTGPKPLKPDLPDYHVMFASQQSSDCRDVCLHCREMGMIYMHHWKQRAWVWISAVWLQVQISVSRSMYSSSQCLTSGGLINSDCISAPFLFRTCLVHKEFELSHQIFAVGGPGWLGISHLDQEYMYVFGYFSGFHKFRVTTYQYTVKLRSVRLLCRIHLGLKSVSPPTFSSQKMLLSNLKQLATLQYRSTSVVVIVHL